MFQYFFACILNINKYIYKRSFDEKHTHFIEWRYLHSLDISNSALSINVRIISMKLGSTLAKGFKIKRKFRPFVSSLFE